MRKFLIIVSLLFLYVSTGLFAHTPLLMLEDNDDGTLTVEGGFSTGAGAAGVDFYVKRKIDGSIILQQKFPESSIIDITIPQEPYYLVFDGGPGHKIVKDGPEPPDGFTINLEAVSMHPEKSDASGIPIPIPVIIIIIVVAVIIVFVVPRFFKKKKAE